LEGAGFTLVELLVVIAIVALLAGLFLPVLGQVKGKARSMACLNNERQLAIAFQLYCDENLNTFPTAAASSAVGAHPEDWIWWQSQTDVAGGMTMRNGQGSALAPFLGGYKPEYFRCPDDRDALARQRAWQANMGLELYTYSYSLNAHSQRGMASFISKDRTVVVRNKLGTVVKPSQKIMLAEEKGSPMDGPGSAFINDGRWQPTGYPLTQRHAGKANAAFADGHVEGVPRSYADGDHPEHFDPDL